MWGTGQERAMSHSEGRAGQWDQGLDSVLSREQMTQAAAAAALMSPLPQLGAQVLRNEGG